ncbi:hypothetical protein PACTADRAFT_4276 [Pachysolen tannophilus NRRL Y-2460]|uniref:triacylglycerol lipase n=1 Tax=Pachysolen tannophilus NRRL Y-2460 TaxID=669874 RepID=A0A1E4TRH9_PACTA|nr:hypothetical protein PACTADRAFT_4276 [Pachysolen tannophilus NRRL Y-2460]
MDGFIWIFLLKCLLVISISQCKVVNTTEYSPAVYDTLVELTKFCSVATCIKYSGDNKAELQKKLPPDLQEGYEIYKVFELNGIKSGSGYIALDHNGGRILIVFRGSSSTVDYFYDLNAIPVPYKPLATPKDSSIDECSSCITHQGFYTSFIQLYEKVIPVVKDLKKMKKFINYKVVVTGHSLGGALSTLAGIELQLLGYEPLVVAIAAPKIGSPIMAQWIDQIFQTESHIDSIAFANGDLSEGGYYRIDHEGDYVPLLPPTAIYAHGGARFYIGPIELPHLKENTFFTGSYQYTSVSEQLLKDIRKGENPQKRHQHTRYFMPTSRCK